MINDNNNFSTHNKIENRHNDDEHDESKHNNKINISEENVTDDYEVDNNMIIDKIIFISHDNSNDDDFNHNDKNSKKSNERIFNTLNINNNVCENCYVNCTNDKNDMINHINDFTSNNSYNNRNNNVENKELSENYKVKFNESNINDDFPIPITIPADAMKIILKHCFRIKMPCLIKNMIGHGKMIQIVKFFDELYTQASHPFFRRRKNTSFDVNYLAEALCHCSTLNIGRNQNLWIVLCMKKN